MPDPDRLREYPEGCSPYAICDACCSQLCPTCSSMASIWLNGCGPCVSTVVRHSGSTFRATDTVREPNVARNTLIYVCQLYGMKCARVAGPFSRLPSSQLTTKGSFVDYVSSATRWYAACGREKAQ